MKLASILTPELILCDLTGTNRSDIYRTMLEHAAKTCELELNPKEMLELMLEREAATHLPYEGVAFPHILVPKLRDLYVIVGLLRERVMLKDYDAAPSRVVVMSLISEDTTSTYLRCTTAFVRYLAKADRLDALQRCRTPEEVRELLTRDDVTLKKTLTAEDLYSADWPSVHLEDSLSTALDVCTRSGRSTLAVVDGNNALKGVLDATEVIRSFIPDYVFMMDSVNFVASLEVFERIFNAEERHQVRDYMTPAVEITPDTPLIQCTMRLVRRESRSMFVVDRDRKFLGGIDIMEVVRRVLRG